MRQGAAGTNSAVGTVRAGVHAGKQALRAACPAVACTDLRSCCRPRARQAALRRVAAGAQRRTRHLLAYLPLRFHLPGPALPGTKESAWNTPRSQFKSVHYNDVGWLHQRHIPQKKDEGKANGQLTWKYRCVSITQAHITRIPLSLGHFYYCRPIRVIMHTCIPIYSGIVCMCAEYNNSNVVVTSSANSCAHSNQSHWMPLIIVPHTANHAKKTSTIGVVYRSKSEASSRQLVSPYILRAQTQKQLPNRLNFVQVR